MLQFKIDAVSDLIRECSDAFILPRYQSLRDEDIKSKTNPRDLVTLADIEAEAFLEKHLPLLLYNSLLIGEEGISRDDHSLDALSQDEQPVWVVDPVDGTYNFAHGRPNFGVMVALVYKGQVICSWIYDVLAERMYVAETGSGAFCNQDRLQVSSKRNPADMIGHMNLKFFPEHMRPEIEEAMSQLKDTNSLGSAAHEYTRIARGESDMVIYSRLKPWDHLPGSLLVREAGGVVSKWDRKPYGVADDYAGLIVTNSQDSWDQLFEMTLGRFDLSAYI